jgi:hypothetical protein
MIFHPTHFHGFSPWPFIRCKVSGFYSGFRSFYGHSSFRFYTGLRFLLWNQSALLCTPSPSGSLRDPSRFLRPCLRTLRTHPSHSGPPSFPSNSCLSPPVDFRILLVLRSHKPGPNYSSGTGSSTYISGVLWHFFRFFRFFRCHDQHVFRSFCRPVLLPSLVGSGPKRGILLYPCTLSRFIPDSL